MKTLIIQLSVFHVNGCSMLLCIWYSSRAKAHRSMEHFIAGQGKRPGKKRVINFLQWYKVNVVKANGYKILSKDKSG